MSGLEGGSSALSPEGVLAWVADEGVADARKRPDASLMIGGRVFCCRFTNSRILEPSP